MKLLKALGIFLAAAIFIAIALHNSYVDLIDPYRWDDPVTKDAESNGLRLLQIRKGGELIFPWTLIFPYTTHISFVNPATVRDNGRYVLAEIFLFYRSDRGRVEGSKEYTVLSCTEKVFAFINQNDKSFRDRLFREDGGPMLKFWTEMTPEMKSYFCRITKHD